ncbi:hypothetical protein [Streptomyces sp. MP131-18]|uniref:hypothetical protein n=1 Tax=Streptomyces sp. MP131-18 TaxID=1857892 RepID=UPI0009C7AC0A|nr:hypothetical protein [Streptomyces sp. MP131-18]ONK11554.1 hypothetical protein STBA_22890 [Streptomyces sp. MP131-18]
MVSKTFTKATGREVVRLCVPGGSRLSGTGMSGVVVAHSAAVALRAAAGERPILAPVATDAYATTVNVAGAGHQIFGHQKTQLHTMWALRGLNPWSDPA